MVLPLPVPPKSHQEAVRFINLEGYANFFDDLLTGFPKGRSAGDLDAAAAAGLLAVHDVGDYEASFVPALADFDRLDSRFRLSDEIWKSLPSYHDYGFAVFKLKGRSTQQRVHPMALEFPSRFPGTLFFPTIHVHEGVVSPKAMFDHMLYCQLEPDHKPSEKGWQRSTRVASKFMQVPRSDGILQADSHCWSRSLKGMFKNGDTLLASSPETS